MADTRLILHVKGTEAETKELPKEDVKTAVAEGRLSYSQLIWSAPDQAWKQVRELPDLLPGESLILHVKGTESQTRELPTKAVREAISRGEITNSQLIWSPLDSAWKPVSELPDLMPGESLILHVKGSTAETKEMPKKAVRAAIKEGQISHSQLIWSPAEHQWKQVRDLPELLPSQKLAPAPVRKDPVPMLPSKEAAAAPVPAVRVATAASATATPRARPAVVGPPRVTIAQAQPRVAQAAATAATDQPQVATASVAASPAPVPRVAQAAAPSPQVRAAVAAGPKPVVARALPYQSPPVGVDHTVEDHDDGFHPMKWVCIGLGTLLFFVVAANYFMVDRPLQLYFGETRYSDVSVYAHYGAFVQPNVMVIHIPASDKITPENITDFLVALAQSTPKNPVTGDYFERVALTSRWTAQYSFAGSAWKDLGEMQKESADDREVQILSSGSDAGGRPLLGESTLNDADREAMRNEAWKKFVANFSKAGP